MYEEGHRHARRLGYRSGLELKISDTLKDAGIDFTYEKIKIQWEDLAYRTYTPDFVLPNNIIVETKGRFVAADRRKHKLIKSQHPTLDIRFVFSNSRARIAKGSKTTYAMWCENNGFLYSDVSIPDEWLEEPPKSSVPTFVTFPNKRKIK
jgi:hypothetical protein